MQYKNVEMEQMIAALGPLLGRTDKVGYAAARNARILRDAAHEYLVRRDELIAKYGEVELDEAGEPTGQTVLKVNSPAFVKFQEEITEWAVIEHEVELYVIPVSDAVDAISGAEMLAADWMFDWGDGK